MQNAEIEENVTFSLDFNYVLRYDVTCFLVNFLKVMRTFSSLLVEVGRRLWLVWSLLKYNIVEAVQKSQGALKSKKSCLF